MKGFIPGTLLALAFVGIAAADDAPNADASGADAPKVVQSLDIRWGPNIAAHSATNFIDPKTHTNVVSGGGYYGMHNAIGDSSVDPEYVPGTAIIATIGGGYDNINNQLAGTIAGGAHHILYNDGDHGTISGGSSNYIMAGSYSTIAGGGGGGAPQYITGERSTISGGGGNIIDSHYSTISGGMNNTIEGYAGTIGGGRNNSIFSSSSFATGFNNTILSHAAGSAVFGQDVASSSPGSINVSGRGKDGQAILFNLNNKTINNQRLNLLGTGSWTTPKIPEASIWTGDILVTGADTAGRAVAYKLTFVATSKGVKMFRAEVLLDEIGVAEPSLAISSRRFLLYVNGGLGSTITWNATSTVSQANF
jgi:hypothetical protein